MSDKTVEFFRQELNNALDFIQNNYEEKLNFSSYKTFLNLYYLWIEKFYNYLEKHHNVVIDDYTKFGVEFGENFVCLYNKFNDAIAIVKTTTLDEESTNEN